MSWIIDRFEEGLAVIEERGSLETIVCPASDLPEGSKEGTALVRDGGRFLLDYSGEALSHSRKVREKMDNLKKRTN